MIQAPSRKRDSVKSNSVENCVLKSFQADRFKRLTENIEKFTFNYHKKFQSLDFITLSFNSSLLTKSKYSALKPLVVSELILERAYNEVIDFFIEKGYLEVKSWLVVGEGDLLEYDKKQIRELRELFTKIRNYNGMAKRWDASLCKHDNLAKNIEYDVRRSANFIPSEWKVYSQKKSMDEMIEYVNEYFGFKFYTRYFALNGYKGGFKCEKDSDTVKMHVPWYENNQRNQSFIKRMLSRYFVSLDKKFQIVPLFTNNPNTTDSVSIGFRDNVIPYVVNNGELRITMSSNLNDEMFVRLLGHEFGHIMGLPDCYVEMYDSHREELTYYELDTRNHMCSVSDFTRFPESSLIQIRDKLCIW